MLNLYTEKDLLTEKNRSHVFPLLFDLVYVKDTGFSDYYQLQNDFKNADIGVWPLEYGYSMLKFKEKLEQFLTEADS
ncbi:MAG: hypothetical protein KJN66_01905, partial [Bacteroidia bacterium]|nr:hypothetical protein [Bacteroidia bacterium]